MRVRCTCIDAQIGHLAARQRATGKHALDRLHHNALRMRTFEDLACGAALDPAGIACVPIVWLVALVARHLHFFSVDDDDIVAHIHMGREGRLVLAAQPHGDDRGKTTENNALSVNHDP